MSTLTRHILTPLLMALMALGSAPLMPQAAYAQDDELPKFSDLKPSVQSELGSLLELAQNNEKRGKFAKSLGYYLEAHKLFPHPKLYYNIAVCYERMADARNAVRYYNLYMKEMPKGDQVAKANARVKELQKRLVRQNTSLIVTSSPPGAVVYLNDITNGPVGTTPTTELPVQPGKYTIILKLEGFEDLRKEAEVKSGTRAEFKYVMKPLPKKNTGGKTTSSSPIAPWVFLGTGVAFTGATVGFFLYEQEIDDNPEEYDSSDEEFATTMMLVCGAGAILSFAASILLFATSGDSVSEMTIPIGTGKATVSTPMPWFNKDSAGIGIQGRF